jgi:hypothetical protein
MNPCNFCCSLLCIRPLAKKDEEEQSFLVKLGLNDWKFAIPVGMLVGIPALSNEIIVLDAEMQLTACFVLFCSTMYTQVGPMIAKSLDSYGKEVADELKDLDKAFQSQIKTAISANEQALSLSEDFKQLYALSDSLSTTQAQVLNNQEEHKYREAIVKKLDSLYALEESASSAIRNRTLNAVKADVLDTFTNDKKIKEDALNQAIAVLSAGAGAKIGKDVVGDVFTASLQKYKSEYAKKPAGSDEILANLEKEIAAISQAPVVQGKGGNVYITHPIA